MLPANAAAIVGAGALSVLLYPAAAVAPARRDRDRRQAPVRGGVAPAAADSTAGDGNPGPAGSPALAGNPTVAAFPWTSRRQRALAERAVPRARRPGSRASRGRHAACQSVAMPWPTPMHIVAAARATARRRNSCSSVAVILAPEQPIG